MGPKTDDKEELGRWLDINLLTKHTHLGVNRARDLGVASGAAVRFGGRILYDREKIDAYLEQLAE